jgi:hypothetical protein
MRDVVRRNGKVLGLQLLRSTGRQLHYRSIDGGVGVFLERGYGDGDLGRCISYLCNVVEWYRKVLGSQQLRSTGRQLDNGSIGGDVGVVVERSDSDCGWLLSHVCSFIRRNGAMLGLQFLRSTG